MTGTKVTLQLLRLLNALLDGGGSSVCETACLLGVIPPALRFVENSTLRGRGCRRRSPT